MARLCIDENFPFPVVDYLRKHGRDVVTIQESGYGGISTSDEEVLKQATKMNRVVLSLNRKHLIRLHSQIPNNTGIIVCSFDPDFYAFAIRIIEALCDQESFQNRLIRINRPVEREKS